MTHNAVFPRQPRRLGARARRYQEATDKIARRHMDQLRAELELQYPVEVHYGTWIALAHLEAADPGYVPAQVLEGYIAAMHPQRNFGPGQRLGIDGMIKRQFVEQVGGSTGGQRRIVLGVRGRNALRMQRISQTIEAELEAETKEERDERNRAVRFGDAEVMGYAR